MKPAAVPALVLALAACAAAPVAPGRPPPGDDPSPYFPLAVGNTWTFADQSPALPDASRGATRTIRIVGRTADGFFRDDQGNELRGGPDCVRDRVRQLLCGPLKPGTRWTSTVSVGSTERYEIVATGETVATPAGSFDRCVRVRATNRASGGVENVLETTYAPGVGQIRIETWALVGGKVSPQFRAVLASYRVSAAQGAR
ncbi:MAG: hypothetical protein U0229_02110 [Anaeromyxobacter sp.]